MNHVTSQLGRARTDVNDRHTQPTTPGQEGFGMAAAMQKLWSTQELADWEGTIRYRPSEVERWIDGLNGRAA